MSIRDEIDALPEKPKKPDSTADFDEWSAWLTASADYERAHREMAERLLREMVEADDAGVYDAAWAAIVDDARVYLARREAE